MKPIIFKTLVILSATFASPVYSEDAPKPRIIIELEQPLAFSDITARPDSYPKITLALSFLALLATVYIFHRQMRIQHRDKLVQQKLQSKDELKVAIYAKLVDQISESVELLSQANINFFMLASNLYHFWITFEKYPDTAKWYSPDAITLNQNLNKALDSAIDARILLERYEVLMPNIEIFGKAFAATIYDIRNTYLTEVHPLILEFIPLNIELGHDRPYRGINEQELNNLQEVSRKLSDEISLLSTYVGDLATEAQNLLIGDIFESKAKTRQPIDHKKYFVITTNPKDQEKLNDYFENHTNWGKANKQASTNVINDLIKEA